MFLVHFQNPLLCCLECLKDEFSGLFLQILNLSAYKENLTHFVTIDIFRESKFSDTAYQTSSLRCSVLNKCFSDAECCLSVSERACIRAHVRNIRNFTTFTRPSSHCPAARCVSAANTVCKSTDIFRHLRLNVNELNEFNSFLFFCIFLCLSYCCR